MTTTSVIFLSWSVPDGSVVTSYEVEWSSDQCPDNETEGSATITDSSTSYTIMDLRPGTSYNIPVTASNLAGDSPTDTFTMETDEMSEY